MADRRPLSDDKTERRAAALRANLHRRKAQMRGDAVAQPAGDQVPPTHSPEE